MPSCAFYNSFHSKRYKNVSLFQIPTPRFQTANLRFIVRRRYEKAGLKRYYKRDSRTRTWKNSSKTATYIFVKSTLKRSTVKTFPKGSPFKQNQFQQKTFPSKVWITSANAPRVRKEKYQLQGMYVNKLRLYMPFLIILMIIWKKLERICIFKAGIDSKK